MADVAAAAQRVAVARAALAAAENEHDVTVEQVPFDQRVQLIIDAVNKEAESQDMSAAYGGGYGAGGHHLKAQLSAWQDGAARRIPEDWKRFLPKSLGGAK